MIGPTRIKTVPYTPRSYEELQNRILKLTPKQRETLTDLYQYRYNELSNNEDLVLSCWMAPKVFIK